MTDQDSHQNKVSVRDLAQLTWKNRKFVVIVTAVCGAAGVLLSLVLPKMYTADTELMPPQQNQSMASMLLSQLGGGVGAMLGGGGSALGLKDPNALYLGILTSPAVEDPIIRQLDLQHVYKKKLMSSARKKLEKRSVIKSSKEGLIRIEVEDRDPKRAAAIANAYSEQLRIVNSGLATTEAGQRRIFFEKEVANTHEQLAKAETALKETQQKTGLIELQGQGIAAIEETSQVRGQIAAEQIQLKQLLSYATDNFPQVITLKEGIAGLQSRLAELEKKPGAGNGDVQVSTGQLPEVGLAYLRAYRDVRYYETVYDLLAKQYEMAKLDEAREGGVIQVLYPAVEPDKPSFPSPPLITLLAIMLGLLGSIFWLTARELLREPNAELLASSAPAGDGQA